MHTRMYRMAHVIVMHKRMYRMFPCDHRCRKNEDARAGTHVSMQGQAVLVVFDSWIL